MKRPYILVLGAILAGTGAYTYLHRQDLGLAPPSSAAAANPASPATPAPPAPASTAPFDWAAVDRPLAGFRLEMPTGTRQIDVPAYNLAGAEQPVQMIFSDPDGGSSFSIAWADNPPVEQADLQDPLETLASARDGALARTHAALVSQSSGDRQGYPSLDFEGRNGGGGILDARLILAGRRLYLLMAAFPADHARRSGDIAHFFDSFQIVDTPRGG